MLDKRPVTEVHSLLLGYRLCDDDGHNLHVCTVGY